MILYCPWDDCWFTCKSRRQLYRHIVDLPHEGIARKLAEYCWMVKNYQELLKEDKK